MANKPGPKPKGNIRIDVFIPPYQKIWLEEEAKKHGVSLAEITRRILDQFMQSDKVNTQKGEK